MSFARDRDNILGRPEGKRADCLPTGQHPLLEVIGVSGHTVLTFRTSLFLAAPTVFLVLLMSGCGMVPTPPLTAGPATAPVVSPSATPSLAYTDRAPLETPMPVSSPTAPTHVPSTSTPTPIPSPTVPTLVPSPAAPTLAPSPTAPTLPPPPTEPKLVPSPTIPATAVVAGPAVSLDGVIFPVELAITSPERQQGLSDRPALAPGSGMLFIFEAEQGLSFWMKNMHFPLDMVWIGAGCTVVDISRDVPAPLPGTKNSDLPTYSPEGDAQYVLEINAGEAQALGLGPGAPVSFEGTISGEYGC